jgi:hypothetical protein
MPIMVCTFHFDQKFAKPRSRFKYWLDKLKARRNIIMYIIIIIMIINIIIIIIIMYIIIMYITVVVW